MLAKGMELSNLRCKREFGRRPRGTRFRVGRTGRNWGQIHEKDLEPLKMPRKKKASNKRKNKKGLKEHD